MPKAPATAPILIPEEPAANVRSIAANEFVTDE